MRCASTCSSPFTLSPSIIRPLDLRPRNSVPFTTNGASTPAFRNAYQFCSGFYTGVTNVFGNVGVLLYQNSQNNNQVGGGPPAVLNSPEAGVIKYPPFVGINQNGGAPDNAWVDVSLEVTRQTNFTLLVARQPIMNGSITNGPATPPFGSVLCPLTRTPMPVSLD